MKHVWLIVAFAVYGIPSCAHARSDDIRQTYVGGSGCKPELRPGQGLHGARLDKTQRAYLKVYTLDDHNLLFIVQYSDDQDHCGIVRDVVETKDLSSGFVFDCTDPRAPHDVVVGTWGTRYSGITGRAVVAWRINLRELKFLSIPGSVLVRCTSGPGPDDQVADLAELAKKRTPKFQ
jgi:hypothetical protein